MRGKSKCGNAELLYDSQLLALWCRSLYTTGAHLPLRRCLVTPRYLEDLGGFAAPAAAAPRFSASQRKAQHRGLG